jgi:hypothetical protein
MRFLVSEKFREEIREWLLARHRPGNRSKWYPFYRMPGTGEPAIMVNVEPEDAVAFALTFDHVKMDQK